MASARASSLCRPTLAPLQLLDLWAGPMQGPLSALSTFASLQLLRLDGNQMTVRRGMSAGWLGRTKLRCKALWPRPVVAPVI